MDRFKELGIDTHGRTSGKMKTKCPWCHAQRTDKRDKSLSVNLDTKLYLCHYCGAHGSAAIYAGKGRKLGDPLVKFPTATGSNSSCPPTEKPHGDPEQGALTQKQIEWCRDVRHIPPEVLVEAGVAFASISMPISGKEKGWEKRDCLCFNFFENGELVNTKFRDSQKHFKLLQGHSHRSKLNGVVTSATFRRKYWWKLAWLSPPSRCLYPERRKAGKRGTVSASTFSKTGNW